MMEFEAGDGFPRLVVSSGWADIMDVLGRCEKHGFGDVGRLGDV